MVEKVDVDERRVSSKGIDAIDSEQEKGSLRKIEAALFIAGRFLSLKELVALTDVNPIFLRKMLDDLTDRYVGRGIRIIKREDLWKMDVAEEHVGMVNKLATGSAEFTRAEQETLAIIAYKQPMKQSVLVKIRGNKAYEHVRDFVKMGLVGKKRMGHTAELTLSDSFYDYFSLEKRGGLVIKEEE